MSILILCLLIALIFGIGGLLTAAKWLLIVALIMVIIGAFSTRS